MTLSFYLARASEVRYMPAPAFRGDRIRRVIVKTWQERRLEKLKRRLEGRLRKDGTPMAGFEQSVASIRAELATLSVRVEKGIGENGR